MSTPNPPSGGMPLRALAMVLIALAILFAGIGALSWSRSGPAAENAAAQTTTETTPPAPSTTPEADIKAVDVRVFNNSEIAGLAAQAASRLSANGWNVTETGNYADSQIPETTVYYGDGAGEEEAAKAIADELGAAVEPRFAGIADADPGVIVILTAQ